MPVLGILGSGSGSNFIAIAEAIRAGKLPARIGGVVGDCPGSWILERARNQGFPCLCETGEPFRSKLDGPAEDRVIAFLRSHKVNTVVLAGFMRMVKDGLLNAFAGRVLNIHPSLLPAFPGLAAWEQALRHGVKVSGCTVHFVDAGMDTGPIILQRVVEVMDDDTPQSLHRRIQRAEHEAYPEAIRRLAEGRLEIAGRRVRQKK